MKYLWILLFAVFVFSAFIVTADSDDIFQAAAEGDLETVKRLLKSNPKLAMQFNEINDSPIRVAILNGRTEVARLIISYMDDVDIKTIGANTPLIYAAHTGNSEITKLLIKKGADVNHRNSEGRSPLYYATRQGKNEVAELLIKNGADVNSKTKSGGTPLRIAIEQSHKSVIDLLVSNNVNLEIRDKDDGIRLLHKLSEMGQEKLVLNLIEQGVDIGSRDEMNRTVLHSAAAGGLNNIISRLIQKGMKVNTTDIYGSIPLHEAVYRGHKDTVKLLLSNGGDINFKRPDGTTPLHLAREREKQDIVDLLLLKGAEDKPKIFPELRGDYMDQKRPGDEGVIFAPGIISKAEYWEQIHGFFENNSLCIIFVWFLDLKIDWTQWPPFLMEKVEDIWNQPYQSKLVGKPWFYNLKSIPEGERVIFPWRKNLDGSGSVDELYLWSATRTAGGWTEPTRFKPPINGGFDTWPSLSNDKTLYFHSWRAGSYGRDDIYMSKLEDGDYRSVENLGKVINTEYTEHDPYIAPDGSYLLFSSYKPGSYGEDDMYVSYRKKDGSWCKPINLGAKINSKYSDNRAFVTSDGKFIFYASTRTGNLDVYWVDAKVIEKLKPKDL
jgi:ankyrin repeat protein